jgi:aminotransferase
MTAAPVIGASMTLLQDATGSTTADRPRISRTAAGFTDSMIREMTRLANQHGAVNLSQGFPDYPAPQAIKQAACDAILENVNQYATSWGARALVDAIGADLRQRYGLPVVADQHVTVCCGSTEAMMSVLLAIVDPGDEVIVFEPFYETYGPDARLAGATPRYIPLREPDWSFDPDQLAGLFNNKTRAIIINTPNNPTGKVFERAELETIARLCRTWNVIAVMDEIYDHFLYDGAVHVPMASLEGMAERTVAINSLSKTFSVTGWRVGWTVGPPEVTAAIRKVHDFVTCGAAAPLQAAAAVALAVPPSYYAELVDAYRVKRDRLVRALNETGFKPIEPKGAYYLMADVSMFGYPDDVSFATHLVKDVGVATVPGSSFYHDPALGRQRVRFCFCKKDETIEDAAQRLAKLKTRV